METSAAPTLQKRKLRGVFGFSGDRAIVIGLPDDFSFQSAVASATRIRLATAFAHLKGWHLIKSAILGSNAHTQLLTGLDFFQTEPKLLREWSRLTVRDESRPQIEAGLARQVTTFHPKILIVSSAVNFAIVGSGNLSFGGLRTNTECSLYTEDFLTVASLIDWFDDEWRRANALNDRDIEDYERKYKELRKARERMRKEQAQVQETMQKRAEAIFRERKKALAEAAKYFKSSAYSKAYEDRKEGAGRIRDVLGVLPFGFNKDEWSEFFSITALGKLLPIYRDRMFRNEKRLKEGLNYLLDEGVDIQRRLAAVLDKSGKFHIQGLGINLLSKILAVHGSRKWPVFNEPVEKTLRHFGYEPPRSAGAVGRYLKFAEAMEGFRRDSGAPDVFALDAFFKWYASKKLGTKR